MVHRTMTLVSLQATIQRELGVPFQDQRLFLFGDELEGDDELHAYGIQNQSELTLKVCKRHRRISDVFSRIKTIRFANKASVPEDYEVIEVVAPLPALPIVFRRIILVISYLTTLDRLQARRTHRRVWRASPFAASEEQQGDASKRIDVTSCSPRHQAEPASPRRQQPTSASSLSCPGTDSQQQPPAPPQTFVSQHATTNERIVLDGGTSQLAAQLHVQQHLKVPPDIRTPSGARQIRRWLATLKYFVDARVPDSVLQEVARAATYVAFKPGDFIFRQGDPGDYFYILITGCVALAAYGNGYFATMSPGACFGEISLLEARSLRSASANVAFATPVAELAIVPGDVYRRFINQFKQAVLQTNEHALFAIVQLRALPPSALTHLAYGIKVLSVRPGKRLIRRGEVVKVLVLLVKGAVKVSSAQQQQGVAASAFPPKLRKNRSSLSESHATPTFVSCSMSSFLVAQLCPPSNKLSHLPCCRQRIVSVVNGPAVFGQEGALSNSSAPAPWDVEAIDTCSLVCIRPDAVSIFLSPCLEVVRSLLAEHRMRIQQFEQRFALHHTASNHPRGSSRMLLTKKKSSLHLVKPPPTPEANPSCPGALVRAVERIVFPKILLKDDDDTGEPIVASSSSNRNTADDKKKLASSPSARGSRPKEMASPRDSPRRPYTSPDSILLASRCAARQDEFLHRALPFAHILPLRDQIRFASFTQQMSSTTDAQTRVGVLLDGLRRLPHEDVRLVSPVTASASSRDGGTASDGDAQYFFSALPSR